VPVTLQTTLLLIASNFFMTYAWYAHLRNMAHWPWSLVALASWGMAFFEYQLQVPANRIGATALTLPELKILQEVVSLGVFVPFSALHMRQPVNVDFFWAGLCMQGAVFFVFCGTAGVV